jgi:hypothetical protein
MKEPNYWDWCSCKDLGVQWGTFISDSKAAPTLRKIHAGRAQNSFTMLPATLQALERLRWTHWS